MECSNDSNILYNCDSKIFMNSLDDAFRLFMNIIFVCNLG